MSGALNSIGRLILMLGALLAAMGATAPSNPTARQLMEGAIDLTRGLSSYAELKVTVHLPDAERTSTLKAWTQGRGEALIRFVAPPRDAGNATLKQGENMWTYAPKVRRVVRLPFSMMSQSWGGSDFSYNDLSRTDDLLKYYELTMQNTEQRDGHTIYTIEALPHDDAPIVWGKEVLQLRDDYVLLQHTFLDQSSDPKPLKRLEAEKVGEVNLEKADHWTRLEYLEARFDLKLEDSLFTVFSLESGKEP
jgi:outer membrane lipoprotein-sorting protein